MRAQDAKSTRVLATVVTQQTSRAQLSWCDSRITGTRERSASHALAGDARQYSTVALLKLLLL